LIPKNILITGATGLIGTRLTELLVNRGHTVSQLSRSSKSGKIKAYRWDIPQRHIDDDAFNGVDTIIHLAGAGIADKPWTKHRKQEILESRTESSRLLFETLKKDKKKVSAFISASAIGYYGIESTNERLSESAPPGNDFLATVAKQWEAEVDNISTLGIRVVKVRTGIVLSEQGGVLKEVAKAVKYFVGSPLGSGNQIISWIHVEDLCQLYARAVETESMAGAYNAVAPNPVTNRELTKCIAKVLKKPLILPPVPEFALRFLFGEMADLILYGSKVSSEKIEATGFRFQFTNVEDAVRNLLH